MVRTNTAAKEEKVYTAEGALAQKVDPYRELRRSVLTCLLWEEIFYESGNTVATRIADLVPKCTPQQVVDLAVEARSKMQLRHVPLYLIRELARIKGNGSYVAAGLSKVIQRADELSEFLAIYWKDKKQPLSAGVKRGLAEAFQQFSAYSLAKYDQDSKVKLRDVLFMVHAKPKAATSQVNNGQFEYRHVTQASPLRKGKYHRGRVDRNMSGQGYDWYRLIARDLPTPDTWEANLSAGEDKKVTFERLLEEGKLGGLAVLRNLRNMQQAGVREALIRERLLKGCERALPFRFIAAAKYAPGLEDAIEQAMLLCVEQTPKLPGRTLLIVDTSGSMNGQLSAKSGMTRVDAACGVTIMAREICEQVKVYATAGDDFRGKHATMLIPARRGFALSDAIKEAPQTIGGGGIFLVQCLDYIASQETEKFDRVIIFTDEQDCDRKANPASAKKLGYTNYVVNVAPHKNGISYKNGWEHIDGWSEHVLDYIRDIESENTPAQSSQN